MPIAAVPDYLKENDPEFYLSSPPGHRFLLYFASWGFDGEKQYADWRKKDKVRKFRRVGNELIFVGWTDVENNQFACTIAACKTPPHTDETPRERRPTADPGLKPWKPMLEALAGRQSLLAGSIAAERLLRLDALATAPFTTGLGNEHPLENGFAFLNPYGLPYLPGSGVKGVLRQAARELASGEWGGGSGWQSGDSWPHPGNRTLPLSISDVLFGLESADGDAEHLRGVLTFWDVIPQIQGNSLAVEVMTPHQNHYYQQTSDRKSGSSVSPHDSGAPNPISFLTVPPGSSFAFHVVCDFARLQKLAPPLAADGRWKPLLTAAFEHAFQWLGFGAKTAVGYGAMKEDPTIKAQREEAARIAADAARKAEEEAARKAKLETLPPAERVVRAFLDARPDKNQPELSALLGGLKQGRFDGEHKVAVARHAQSLMRTAKRWKEKTEKKNPEKDGDYQDTLRVLAWASGK